MCCWLLLLQAGLATALNKTGQQACASVSFQARRDNGRLSLSLVRLGKPCPLHKLIPPDAAALGAHIGTRMATRVLSMLFCTRFKSITQK